MFGYNRCCVQGVLIALFLTPASLGQVGNVISGVVREISGGGAMAGLMTISQLVPFARARRAWQGSPAQIRATCILKNALLIVSSLFEKGTSRRGQ